MKKITQFFFDRWEFDFNKQTSNNNNKKKKKEERFLICGALKSGAVLI